MEFDQNLIFNFASIIATLLFTSAAGITIFRRLKLRWPVKVNCWFCNNYTKIYCSELDWWQCPSCEQYNGFTKDGDYAYDIPEQSMQQPKNFAKPHSKCKKTNGRKTESNLCERCNHNEELKILELRTFEPKGFFCKGLENFKRELEIKYPLCDDCKILVQNVLKKQSLWLTRYKMLFYKEKSVNAIINNAEKLDKILRIFLTMLTPAIMYYSDYCPLPVFGAFLQLSAFVINQTHRSSDAIMTFLWFYISLVGPLNVMNLFDFYEINEWPYLENFTEHHCATLLILIIGFTNVTSRYRNTRSFKASFKKLDSSHSKEKTFSILNDSFEDFGNNGETKETQKYSNYLSSPTNDRETTLDKKSIDISRKYGDKQIVPSGTLSKDYFNDYTETGRRHILKFDDNSEQYTLNESLSTLKTLTLGESRTENTTRIPSIFRTRVYGSTSPDLFSRTSNKTMRKFILSPPKLNAFAPTSWVAGGYWQVGADTPSLSRSSSQSSGFGSAGSNFGPSREPSVTKETDKCSIITENTQYCSVSRPNSVNSINSCCRHGGSPIKFNRCENLTYQPLKIVPNTIFQHNSQTHFSPVHPETNGFYESCLSLQNCNKMSTEIQPNRQSSNCSNLSNSTVWLTILLGGSLVFNIAIFCTIILR